MFYSITINKERKIQRENQRELGRTQTIYFITVYIGTNKTGSVFHSCTTLQ